MSWGRNIIIKYTFHYIDLPCIIISIQLFMATYMIEYSGLIPKEEIFTERIVKLSADKLSKIVTTQTFWQGKFQGSLCSLWKSPGTWHVYFLFASLIQLYNEVCTRFRLHVVRANCRSDIMLSQLKSCVESLQYAPTWHLAMLFLFHP